MFNADGKRPTFLLKQFFSSLAPAFCLKICVVPGNPKADLLGSSQLSLADPLSTNF